MTPFESEKHGNHYRSWIERQWGNFFNSFERTCGMNYRWVYEPEGYLLSNGQGYRPDFGIYIAAENFRQTWLLEIKSDWNSYEEARSKLDQFMLDWNHDLNFLVIIGRPGAEEILWFIDDERTRGEFLEFKAGTPRFLDLETPPYEEALRSPYKVICVRHFDPSRSWGTWLHLFELCANPYHAQIRLPINLLESINSSLASGEKKRASKIMEKIWAAYRTACAERYERS